MAASAGQGVHGASKAKRKEDFKWAGATQGENKVKVNECPLDIMTYGGYFVGVLNELV